MIYAAIDANNIVQQVVENDEQPIEDSIYTYRQLSTLPMWPGPTPTSVLSWLPEETDPSWVETATISELKASKNSEINSARLTANRTSFEFMNKVIACDELSRSDIDAVNGIIAITNAMPPNWVGGWKAVDNTYVLIPDVATWISFYGAMVQKGSSNFAHAQALKATLASVNTPEEITAIQWQT